MRLLLQALLILVPFVIYGLWLYFLKRGEVRGWNTAPWFWLTVCGLALFGASFLVIGVADDGLGGGRYVPPRLIDGKVAPAHTD